MKKWNRESKIELLLLKGYKLHNLAYKNDREILKLFRKEVNKIIKKA